ncbi:MAG: ATP-binding protein [Candidatus Eisenbacteria bacterium]
MQGALVAGLDESREALRSAKEDFRKDLKYTWIPRLASGELAGDRGGAPGAAAGGTLVRFLREDEGESPDDEREADLLAWARARDAVETLPVPERVGPFLAALLAAPGGGEVLIARGLPKGMVERAAKITEAVGLLEALRMERGAVIRSYVIPFVLVYAALIGLAVIVGAYLARRMARPLEGLVASTKRVAAGDLETRVAVTGQGETRDLEEAFNRMVERLGGQRAELARLERKAAWRDLARALAHEIKNPLTPIQLAVQEMRDRYGGDDETYETFLAEAAAIVDEEVENLRRLTREFSEFARLPEPKPERGDLRDVLGEVVRLYGEDKVALESPHGRVEALFDGEEIRRALINLVDNGLAACREAERPERVVIRARGNRTGAEIAVIDEGAGIDAGDRERIFEPNFTTKRGGMGLGLAIVEGIVAAHRGAVELESAPGKGTTFTIHLPAAWSPDRYESEIHEDDSP